ncbi:MAG TPA: DNA polymerase I [Myxococcales bacterium]|nr:DNA polymerase I [Myxococcales bacterium]HIL01955.1 DNA polymerase I [Myxococcales bacterium]
MTERSRKSPDRRLVVIDGANALYRAFFALPASLRAPDGTPTNALLGFANMLTKILREESPTWVAVAFDPRGGTFRNRLFEGYKANRDAQPEDLSLQIPLLREFLEAIRVPLLEVPDFEADDVIATLVAATPQDAWVSIVSTDKDLMQLVDERVQLVDSGKQRRYGPAEVEARFGVPPDKILDLRSLVGDPSDNIPGVKGIGEKGAAKLIGEWGTLEALLDNADKVKAKRAREALLEQRPQAELSKELSTLRFDVPLPLGLDELVQADADRERLAAFYRRMGFTTLLAGLGLESETAKTQEESAGDSTRIDANVEIVTEVSVLAERLEALGGAELDPVVLHPVCGAGSAVTARLVGLAMANGDLGPLYVPITAEGLIAEEGLSSEVLVATLEKAWPSADRWWCAFNAKQVQSALGELGLGLPDPVDDLGLAAVLLDPASAQGVGPVALKILRKEVDSWEDLAGKGAKAIAAEEIAVESIGGWAARQAVAIHSFRAELNKRIDADGLRALYQEVEVPLAGVLSRMERMGVRVDEKKLALLHSEFSQKLDGLRVEIYALAGEEFLISSTKQLQVILFEKLNLPVIKKTKTGYSTAEGVLEQLRSHHELPGRILDYRKLSKLMSTYVDALPPLICEATGRIHPSFHQLGAATGRMSASNPNVQNIPIRGEEGARIREAFVPAEGRVLLAADYSQVELRILAHYSGDESLIDAFRSGEDIHRRTAAEVWGVELDAVSTEQRARAKAVNFGIIYGSSAFGLANQLGIAAGEAKETIDAYFERYQGVRAFIDATISGAGERGYVSTLLGRRRYLPDLSSRNRVLRQASERMAVNTVIQGSAADLIKRAMIEVDARLGDGPPSARLILQVHDELVFEVAEGEVRALTELLRTGMENALELKVPIVADFGVGTNWREAH